jgi:hypothetical protein
LYLLEIGIRFGAEMIGSTNTFTGNGQDKRSERRAIVFALQASLLFLFSVASVYKTYPRKPQAFIAAEQSAKPVITSKVKRQDPNDRYRMVPASFRFVDFGNWSYGRYSSAGNKFDLKLVDGEQTFPFKDGGGETFSVKDVLYADVTGDLAREAIVVLSHVQCSVSCDGSSTLFYIYTYGESGLKKIWEYETGSMAFGCGLKSLLVARNSIVLELFGRCAQPAGSYEAAAKFMIADTTRLKFVFNGKQFVKQLTEVTAVPPRNVVNYEAPIEIAEW